MVGCTGCLPSGRLLVRSGALRLADGCQHDCSAVCMCYQVGEGDEISVKHTNEALQHVCRVCFCCVHRLHDALDELLPEAFATVREASRRVLGMRHFDSQLVGEQQTGTVGPGLQLWHRLGCSLLTRSSANASGAIQGP